jgi:hypothetical protein
MLSALDPRGRALALLAAGVTVAAIGALLTQLLDGPAAVVFVATGVFAAGLGTARLVKALRADPGTREQELLIRALWSIGRRWPDGEGRIDPVTGQVLAVEHHHGFLTLIVATPAGTASGEEPGAGVGDPATVTRYLLGLRTLPAPPPLLRDIEPFDPEEAGRRRTRREAKDLLAFHDQTGAMAASTAEIAGLLVQAQRTVPAPPDDADGSPG